MFGKAVACSALVCAFFGPVVAGDARAHSGSHHRSVDRHLRPSRRAPALSAATRKSAWSPARPNLRQPAAGQARAGIDGRLGDAFMVDTGVVPTPLSWGMNFSYGVASNGDGWRVFWSDNDAQSVYTSGIGSDGSVIDPTGNLVGYEMLSTQGGTVQAIAGTGSGFTAVWTAGENRSIWSARLDSAGNVIDSLLVYDSDQGQAYPAIAFDGDSTCLVAWIDDFATVDIYAARVTTGGRLLDSVPFPVAQNKTLMEVFPSIAFGRGVFLVAWTAFDTLTFAGTAKAARVSAAGQVLDTAIFLRHDPGAIQLYPSVAFGDTCFLATWSEGIEQPDIFATRVSASGEVMDTAAIQLCSDPNTDVFSSIAYDGTNYLVIWEEDEEVWPSGALCGLRLSGDAVPLDSSFIRPRLRDYVCAWPKVSADQGSFLVVCDYTDTTTYNMGVICTRISPQGAVLDSGIILPLGADWQYEPSGASDGTDFLAVWAEDRGGVFGAVSAARITGDGTVLDPVGFPVDTTLTGKWQTAAAFGDSLYLVAWTDVRDSTGADIYCARVGTDGSVFDPGGIPVCRETLDQDYPDISFDGENFLVVWHDGRSNMRGNVYAARVSPGGVVLDPNGFAVAASDSFDDASPAVCFSGSDHLVVWQGYHYNASDDNIYGALVSPAGTITRSRYVIGATANSYQPPVSVARSSGNSLAAWVRDDGAIYAARVRADGTVLDTNAVLVDKTDEYNELPHVTADAEGFRVLWDNWGYMDTTRFGIARIDTAGNLVRRDPWFGIRGTQLGFDAVDGGGPDLLLLFSCWSEAVLGQRFSAYRLWGRLGDVPGIEDAGSQQAKPVASGASIVRGVLYLSGRASSSPSASLLDISGRRVMNLQSGANDVSRLAPGVYFVRDTQAQAVRKIVIQR